MPAKMRVVFYREKQRDKFLNSPLLKNFDTVIKTGESTESYGVSSFPVHLLVRGSNPIQWTKSAHQVAAIARQKKTVHDRPVIVLHDCGGDNSTDCGDYERCNGRLCDYCQDNLGYTRKVSDETK